MGAFSSTSLQQAVQTLASKRARTVTVGTIVGRAADGTLTVVLKGTPRECRADNDLDYPVGQSVVCVQMDNGTFRVQGLA